GGTPQRAKDSAVWCGTARSLGCGGHLPACTRFPSSAPRGPTVGRSNGRRASCAETATCTPSISRGRRSTAPRHVSLTRAHVGPPPPPPPRAYAPTVTPTVTRASRQSSCEHHASVTPAPDQAVMPASRGSAAPDQAVIERHATVGSRSSTRRLVASGGVDLLDEAAVFELLDDARVHQLIHVQVFGLRILRGDFVDHLEHAVAAGIRCPRPERSVRLVAVVDELRID